MVALPLALLLVACTSPPKGDDDDDDEYDGIPLYSTSGPGDEAGLEASSEGEGSPGAGDAEAGEWNWEGERIFEIYSAIYGDLVCSTWLRSYGTSTAFMCPDCSYGFTVQHEVVEDECGFSFPEPFEASLGIGSTMYFEGYGEYEVLTVYFDGEWQFYGIVTDSGAGHLEYYWHAYIYYDYYVLLNQSTVDYGP